MPDLVLLSESFRGMGIVMFGLGVISVCILYGALSIVEYVFSRKKTPAPYLQETYANKRPMTEKEISQCLAAMIPKIEANLSKKKKPSKPKRGKK